MQTDYVKDLLASCVNSTEVSAKIIFPERFHRPFSWMHRDVFKVLDDDSIQKVVIAANRGFGKTSVLQLAYAAKKILFNQVKFMVPISSTSKQAILQSENLKNELTKNRFIKSYFGEQRSNRWSKEEWVTKNGAMILPRGSGQQVRGILHGNDRPDLLLCDDLEDSESVLNEEQRLKLKEWFFGDVLNSVDRASDNWRVIVLGTLLHEDSLLANLLEDPSWYSIRLELFDDNLHSNWPEFMNDDAIRKLVEDFRKAGQLGTLYREYRNLSISTEDARFKQQFFKYYDEEDFDRVAAQSVVLVDPAKTLKEESADTAIVGVGVNPRKQAIYVREVDNGKFNPDELYDRAFAMAIRLGATAIGIEVTSLHEWITYPFMNEMIRRGLNFELIELHARGAKEGRVASLVPFYRRGLVYHNKSACSGLEAQLMSFPRSKKWDIMDSFAYIVEMLEVGGRFFYVDEEVSEEEEKELREMESEDDDRFYKELETGEDEPLSGWEMI